VEGGGISWHHLFATGELYCLLLAKSCYSYKCPWKWPPFSTIRLLYGSYKVTGQLFSLRHPTSSSIGPVSVNFFAALFLCPFCFSAPPHYSSFIQLVGFYFYVRVISVFLRSLFSAIQRFTINALRPYAISGISVLPAIQLSISSFLFAYSLQLSLIYTC
jgi:hypothetical protein